MPLDNVDNLIEVVTDQLLILECTAVTHTKVARPDGITEARFTATCPRNAGQIEFMYASRPDQSWPAFSTGQAVYAAVQAHIAANWKLS